MAKSGTTAESFCSTPEANIPKNLTEHHDLMTNIVAEFRRDVRKIAGMTKKKLKKAYKKRGGRETGCDFDARAERQWMIDSAVDGLSEALGL